MPNQNEDSFGSKLDELEKIASELESGEVDLDKGLKQFERGMELAQELKQRLGKVEVRVKQIKAKYEAVETTAIDDGEPEPAGQSSDDDTLF